VFRFAKQSLRLHEARKGRLRSRHINVMQELASSQITAATDDGARISLIAEHCLGRAEYLETPERRAHRWIAVARATL
jgi:hypothetical protein